MALKNTNKRILANPAKEGDSLDRQNQVAKLHHIVVKEQLTLAKIAEAMKWPINSVGNYLRGRNIIPHARLLQLLDHYGYSQSWYFLNSGDPKQAPVKKKTTIDILNELQNENRLRAAEYQELSANLNMITHKYGDLLNAYNKLREEFNDLRKRESRVKSQEPRTV